MLILELQSGLAESYILNDRQYAARMVPQVDMIPAEDIFRGSKDLGPSSRSIFEAQTQKPRHLPQSQAVCARMVSEW